MRQILVSALLLAAATASPARAAQSYDSCTGFIDSLPTTIGMQGVWCLRADLSTAISDGIAIQVDANNITIDCNGFRLGGLGGGPASTVYGISSLRMNTVVRNCNIRGFYAGIGISSAGGSLIEGNRLDGNLVLGISVNGSGSIIRNNQVFDTGGHTNDTNSAFGIIASTGTDVVANTVFDVAALGENASSYGIYANFTASA